MAFTVIKLDSSCNGMIKAMKENHSELQVTDLEHATKNKSSEEVSKMFVESASYILRAKVGGKPGKKASKRSAVKTGQPLWDAKQLSVGDIFSCISYLRVMSVDGTHITV